MNAADQSDRTAGQREQRLRCLRLKGLKLGLVKEGAFRGQEICGQDVKWRHFRFLLVGGYRFKKGNVAVQLECDRFNAVAVYLKGNTVNRLFDNY
jgi:hypothetical protein